MPQALLDDEIMIGPESAGLLMTAEEFDSIEEYDENYQYELIRGVVVVSSYPPPEIAGPNELLGCFLLEFQQKHINGWRLDATVPQYYVRIGSDFRIADRLVWAGRGRRPCVETDLPDIAVDFVSGCRRDRQREYVDKRHEYIQAGIQEYWIVDRFERTMTVAMNAPVGKTERIIKQDESYESSLLPGFLVPLAKMLMTADQWAK
jgi:Uma2 family endonuclease